MSVSGKKIGVSLAWNFGEKMFTQGIQLVISIVLARILLPEDYGILALVMVFVNILTVFVETGLGSAIVQKKTIEKNEINQLFSINVFVALVLYLAIFLLSPWIASIYSNYDSSLLISVIRVYSLVLPIGSLTSIQSSLLYRKFDFKKLFFVNITTVFVSGAAGIAMAYLGFGVWALVSQQIASKIILGVILLFALEWKPRLKKPNRDTLSMIRYSANILGNRLIVVVYNQFRSLFIGKLYSAEDLAFYNKGETFPSMIATNTDYALQKVMFSAYSKEKDDISRIKYMMRKTISLSTFVLTPIMLGFAAAANNVVLVLLTEKWLPSVEYMRIFCLIYLLQPIKTSSAQALDGMGKSNITLKVGFASKAIGVISLIIALRIGVKAIVIATLITEVISLPFYFYINSKYVRYTLIEQIMDLSKNIFPALVVAGVVLGVGYLVKTSSALVLLLIQVGLGIITYFVVSVIMKNESMFFILNKIGLIKGNR